MLITHSYDLLKATVNIGTSPEDFEDTSSFSHQDLVFPNPRFAWIDSSIPKK